MEAPSCLGQAHELIPELRKEALGELLEQKNRFLMSSYDSSLFRCVSSVSGSHGLGNGKQYIWYNET